MPCNSQYTEATSGEKSLQRTAKLLVYVYEILAIPVPKSIYNAAADYYCHTDFTPELCRVLRTLTPEDENTIVYARNKQARDLANWWEDQQEANKI